MLWSDARAVVRIFSGIAFPFIGHGLRGGPEAPNQRCESNPQPALRLTRGRYAYDFGDTGHMTPLTNDGYPGFDVYAPSFHAGGLRYHGMAPLVSHLKELNLIEATAYTQGERFAAGVPSRGTKALFLLQRLTTR
jgi:tryptophan synthase beta chain